MLQLPIHRATTFVLVEPHYPENVGAAARAIKTMGFTKLCLVHPSKLASPDHEMAQKMAVKSWDVLSSVQIYDSLPEALVGFDAVYATSSRRGHSGALTLRAAAFQMNESALKTRRQCLLLGNEKTGLSREQLRLADRVLRIPMAADQPSINLAQTAQLLAYELFCTALESRSKT